MDAAADRRHRSGAERRWRRGGDHGAISNGSGSAGTKGRCGRASAPSGTARWVRRSATGSTASRSLRENGSPTYQLASVVDDIDFGITHIVRGNDHRPNEALHRRLFEALGATPPEFIHHGLILGDGRAQAREARAGRDRGVPAGSRHPRRGRAGVPRGARPAASRRPPRPRARCGGSRSRRSRRSSDEELAARVGVPVSVAPVLRGARDLAEARAYAALVLEPAAGGRSTRRRRSTRFRELVEGGLGAEGDRSRAEGGRRRPQGPPPRAHRRRARAGARGGDRSASAARSSAAHRTRLGTMRVYDTLFRRARRAAAAARPDRDLLVRPDRLPAHPRRQRARGLRPPPLAEALARGTAATRRKSS